MRAIRKDGPRSTQGVPCHSTLGGNPPVKMWAPIRAAIILAASPLLCQDRVNVVWRVATFTALDGNLDLTCEVREGVKPVAYIGATGTYDLTRHEPSQTFHAGSDEDKAASAARVALAMARALHFCSPLVLGGKQGLDATCDKCPRQAICLALKIGD